MLRIIKVWEEINENIKRQVTDISYRMWFQPLCLEKIDEEEKVIYLTTSNDFAAEVINNRFMGEVYKSVHSVLGNEYRAKINTVKSAKEENEENDLSDELW